MTQPEHELQVDEQNIYHCACGEAGTWAEIKPHSLAVGTTERVELPYDEDAAQDAVCGRPHWGSTSTLGADLDRTLAPLLAAAEPELTCRTCGMLPKDHQLRGHDFVEWWGCTCGAAMMRYGKDAKAHLPDCATRRTS